MKIESEYCSLQRPFINTSNTKLATRAQNAFVFDRSSGLLDGSGSIHCDEAPWQSSFET
jgi:hypothetical protein